MKIVLILLSALFLTNCSQFAEPQGLSNSPRGTVNTADVIIEPLEATFSSIKLNIINKKCISCHKPDSTNKKAAEIPLTRESEVIKGSSSLGDLVMPGEPAKSVFYRVMIKDEAIRGKAKLMPPESSNHPAVTEEELQVVAAWISGTVNKLSPTVTAPVFVEPVIPEPAVLDYAFIKTQLLDKKCVSCHKAGGTAEDLTFDTREKTIALSNSFSQPVVTVGKPEQSLMYLALIKDENTRAMPPKKSIDAGKVKDVTTQEINWIKKWITEGAN